MSELLLQDELIAGQEFVTADSSAALRNDNYRHRGEGFPSAPATPPDKRVRIRRFEELRSTETGYTELIGPA